MKPVSRVEGRAYPLGMANVDTDTIIPAEYLKTISRSGLGEHAFSAVRREPGNVFADPDCRGAPILIAGANFGCGSSREHAVWALLDLGILAIIAPGFSDIFAGNAFKNGMLTVELADDLVDRLLQVARRQPICIDLEAMTVTTTAGDRLAFSLDPFRRECLMKGIDEIGLTLASEAAIEQYEAKSDLLRWARPASFSERYV
jgi:3-isopropylmalate/(R)-2-methylmalate dehydratase small subunit